MGRYQSGSIYERCGSYFVRFYVTEIVGGQSKRVQRSRFLADKDDKHSSASCKAVKKLAADVMGEVNGNRSNNPEIRVVDLWQKTYLPFIEQNLRASTVEGYRQIWGQHLQNHFSTTTLDEHKTHQVSLFLTSLASKLGKRTLSHIRSLASGIFQHALNIGLVESNPIHEYQVLSKTKDVPNTPHYSLDEAENMIAALVDVP